jgi:hypothetical protein
MRTRTHARTHAFAINGYLPTPAPSPVAFPLLSHYPVAANPLSLLRALDT